jgi:alkaline phosphatase D
MADCIFAGKGILQPAFISHLIRNFAPFYHGVASGDALQDRVIIWTRVTEFSVVDSIPVEWFFSTDTLCNNVIQSGATYAMASKDFTVKIDVAGLQPGTWYYFYFRALGKNSLIGRTRTSPSGNNDSLRLAVVSGTNYNNGYFNIYKSIAQRNDFDAVLHLGDYIYEYGTNEYGDHADRALEPNYEILTLNDYRMRYSHYRLDPDHRYLHQQYPWYVIWDDHETANNSYFDGAENHTPGTEGDWTLRKNAGTQAFFEWIPMRENIDTSNIHNKIRHTIPFGDLASLILLDTRLEGRDDPEGLGIDDVNKTMLGAAQLAWFKSELVKAEYTDQVQWKLIGNQVMFAPLLVFGQVVNKDQWDGYRKERQVIMDWVAGMSINNVVILTGDIHTSWAMDVPNSTLGTYGANGQGSAFVEFVTPSVTSPSTDIGGGIGASVIMSQNAHMKWVDLVKRGYFILDVNKTRAQADWYFINTISTANFTESWGNSWYVNNNTRYIQQRTVPSTRPLPFQPQAPLLPQQTTSATVINTAGSVVLGVFPNPFRNEITIQYYSSKPQTVEIKITDIHGKLIKKVTKPAQCEDINYIHFQTGDMVRGAYIISVEEPGSAIQTRKIIKY